MPTDSVPTFGTLAADLGGPSPAFLSSGTKWGRRGGVTLYRLFLRFSNPWSAAIQYIWTRRFPCVLSCNPIITQLVSFLTPTKANTDMDNMNFG